MRKSALDYFACPLCKQALEIVAPALAKEDGHILQGRLRCRGCDAIYPIEAGVPRLLKIEDQQSDLSTGSEYSDYFSLVTQPGVGEEKLYGKTLPEELADLLYKSGLASLDALNGAAFLDAGCGLGRIDGALAAHCSAVAAFDISPAVGQAFRQWRSLPNVHIAQASLTDMPVFAGRFDAVWCDGALPYVSEVGRSVQQLAAARAPHGSLYAWCYGPARTLSQRIGRSLRATGLPLRARVGLAYAAAAAMMLAASLARRKNRFGRTRQAAEGILDLSLSATLNHVSAQQVSAWVRAVHPGAQVTAAEKSACQVVEFWVRPDERP